MRASSGLDVEGYSGAFYKPPNSPTDVYLPAVDSDKALLARLAVTEKLPAGGWVGLWGGVEGRGTRRGCPRVGGGAFGGGGLRGEGRGEADRFGGCEVECGGLPKLSLLKRFPACPPKLSATTGAPFPPKPAPFALSPPPPKTNQTQPNLPHPPTKGSEVYVQSALLYTSTDGARRIRVSTLALPVADAMGAVFKGADLDAQLSVMARQVGGVGWGVGGGAPHPAGWEGGLEFGAVGRPRAKSAQGAADRGTAAAAEPKGRRKIPNAPASPRCPTHPYTTPPNLPL